jgi:hypothetical protein
MAVDQQTEGSPGFGRRPASGGEAAEEKATFRLAAYGALLVVVLFAGYGLGRLNSGTTSASAPTGAADSAKTQSGADSAKTQSGADSAKTQSGADSAETQSGANSAETQSGTGTSGPGTGPSAARDNSMPGMAMDESEPHTHNADGTVTQTAIALPAGSVVGGLSLSSASLTLVPLKTTFAAGRKQQLSFRIAGASGAPVTTFAVVHDKLLHLIVVRRDLTGYQHLHPTMAPDGTWSIDLTLAQPGIYRMIADFTAVVGGQQIAATLGSDLTVAGSYAPAPLSAPVRTAHTAGLDVVYQGTPDTRSVQPMLMSVTRPDGKPAALQPYLGAFGHLVMIRQGDLGYVHIHPEPQLVGGKVKFWLTAPSRGTYRMFFDFQVAGQVHDAAWTVTIKQ